MIAVLLIYSRADPGNGLGGSDITTSPFPSFSTHDVIQLCVFLTAYILCCKMHTQVHECRLYMAHFTLLHGQTGLN